MKTTSSPSLFVSDEGSGEPLLLITGFTISSAIFDPVAHLYVPHVRVVAYDHRGTGRSAAWHAPVSVAMLAADVARVLDDRGIRAAHVVGLSMGAAVALELAIRMPTRVKSLVLVGGAAGGPTTITPPVTDALATIAAIARDSVDRRRIWPAAALFPPTFRDADPERVETLTIPFGEHRAPFSAASWQLLAVSCFARAGSLASVRAPTMVLHGEHDAMSPAGNARLLADAIPCAELALVAGAGHAAPLEQPEYCAQLMVEWVRRNARNEPVAPATYPQVRERLSRPWPLPAGAARNTAAATSMLVRRTARHRPSKS
jgi:3-oxoadipate enol-lactonase